ncbi:MAG: DNA polymerase III subunit gamma/tau, partial [Bacteroidales bacterium]
LDYEYYFRITDAFLNNDISQALLILNDIIGKGFDPQHFITGLSSHLREVMVSKDPVTLSLIEAAPDVAQRYQQQGARCSNPFLYRALEISNECDLNYRASRNKRLLVEIALIRIAQLTAPVTQIQSQANGSQPLQPIAQQPQQQQANPVQASQPVTPPPAPAAQPVAQATISSSVPPPPSPQARPGNKPGMPGIRNISIRNGIKKPEEAQVQEVKMEEMNKSVDNEALEKAWIDFTKTIPTETILINTILSCKPKLLSATQFEVVVDNPEQVDRIKEKGANLLYYLRSTLYNSSLTMNVRESEKNERVRIFSDREKYNQMVQTNPDVVLLKEAFGLDLA